MSCNPPGQSMSGERRTAQPRSVRGFRKKVGRPMAIGWACSIAAVPGDRKAEVQNNASGLKMACWRMESGTVRDEAEAVTNIGRCPQMSGNGAAARQRVSGQNENACFEPHDARLAGQTGLPRRHRPASAIVRNQERRYLVERVAPSRTSHFNALRSSRSRLAWRGLSLGAYRQLDTSVHLSRA